MAEDLPPPPLQADRRPWLADAAWLLFEQALLLEGVLLKDPSNFVQRLNRVLDQSIVSSKHAADQ